MDHLCYQITLQLKHFYSNLERCEVFVIFLPMAVNGRIRDIGQNVLQPSFQIRSGSSLSYCHIVFRNSFLEEACISNIIITQCINYITFTNNSAIFNNNYGGLQDLTLLFKILIGKRKNFFKIYRQFGHAPS